MKALKLTIGIIISALIFSASSCTLSNEETKGLNDQQVNKITTYVKVWGFLKYYHPGLSSGEIDMDSILLADLPQIIYAKKKDFEGHLNNLIHILGEVRKCDSCKNIYGYPEEWSRNLDLEWINNSPLVSANHTSQLIQILENRQQGKGHYVEYAWGDGMKSGPVKLINEKRYADSLVINDYRYRILALARYWNVIEYFFAYKYLLSKDWDQVLLDYLPVLYKESSQLDYNLDILRLSGEIEDSHAGNTYSQYIFSEVWDKSAPFELTTIDGKSFVKGISYKTLNEVNDIMVGDEVLLIDSIPVKDARKEIRAYCTGSNDRGTNSAVDNMILVGHSDKLNLTILRSGELKQVNVRRYPHSTYWALEERMDPVLIIEGNYAYIKLVTLTTTEQVDSVMNLAKEIPNIIFDLRDYPMFDAMEFQAHFVNEFTPGFRAFEPSLDDVGIFKPSVFENKVLESKENYTGEIVVIVNEFTQSYAESIAMFFQTLPQTSIVGSQTSGANGNAVSISLPGNIRASFSNIIVEYPDGLQSQKTGIKIDYNVTTTIEDLLGNNDPYIEKAKEILFTDEL